MLLVVSIFMTGCDATQIVDVITKVADGIKQAAPAIKQAVDAVKGIFGNDNNNNAATNNTATPTQAPQETNTTNPATVTVSDARDTEDITNAATNTPTASQTTETTRNETPITTTATTTVTTQPAPASSPLNISADGKKQLQAVADYALQNHRGASNGQCFNAVWGYLTAVGYGNLKKWEDLPSMKSGEARNFAEFMNASQRNLDEAGLVRLDTSLKPPITSPHDPRIPRGAVIVVGPNSTGTGHPTAGDIVIKAGEGRFVNDGPNMDYGTAATWKGTLLGVYIPK